MTDTDGVTMFEPDTIIVRATDLDIAEMWIDRYAATCRYDTKSGEWVAYERGVWIRLNGDAIPGNKFAQLRKQLVAVKETNGKETDATEWLNQGSRATAVLRNVSLASEVQVHGDRFDQHPDLFNVANGTVNLRSGRFMEHDPGHLITQQAPVHYDTDAKSPVFDRFIREVLPNDAVRGYVQRLFGMALLGDVEQHILPLFVGEGRNGKGSVLRIMSELFGNYATGLQKNVLIETKYEEHSTVLMTLKDRRLAIAEELNRGAQWNVAAAKTLTGGDAITARFMRQDDQTFNPSHTLVLATNHLPSVGDGETAFWMRVRVIEFTQRFDPPDPTIEERIKANELPGVLNWTLAGLKQYLSDGLMTPREVVVASQRAQEEGDPLVTFIQDTYRVTGNAVDTVYVKDVHAAYLEWTRENRDAPSLTNRTIRKRLISAYNATSKSVTLREQKDKFGALITGLRSPSNGDDLASDDDVVTKSVITSNALTCTNDDDDGNDVNLGVSPENREVVSTPLLGSIFPDNRGTSSPSSSAPKTAGQRLASDDDVVTSHRHQSEGNGLVKDPAVAGSPVVASVNVTEREGVVDTGLAADGSVLAGFTIRDGREVGTERVSFSEYVRRMKAAGNYVEPVPGWTWYEGDAA